MDTGAEITVTNPSEFPTGKVKKVLEPMVRSTILAPKDYVGVIMELCQGRRGVMIDMQYLGEDRVQLRYTLPLAEIVFDFFDQLKSKTQGYASLDYEEAGLAEGDLVKVDILLQGDQVDAFSAIVHKDKAYAYGVMMTGKLRELIPQVLLLDVGGAELLGEVAAEGLGLGGERAQGVPVGDQLEALVDALGHGLLHVEEVALLGLYEIAPELVLLLEGDQLALVLVSLVGSVFELFS
jgi:hypothetical protein